MLASIIHKSKRTTTTTNTNTNTNPNTNKNTIRKAAKKTVAKQPESSGDSAPSLKCEGVQVFKILNDKQHQFARKYVQRAVDHFPEYDHAKYAPTGLFHQKEVRLTGGGFACLNTASSFHCDIVRWLRCLLHACILGCTNVFNLGEDDFIQQLPDRLLIRRSHQSPTGESWHRDLSPDAKKGQVIYGGWLNLSHKNQVFSCKPKTALGCDATSEKNGFARQEEDKSLPTARIVIPPGSAIIFDQSILHEVRPSQKSDDGETDIRLHVAWCIGKQKNSMYESMIRERIADQAAFQIKSGQDPYGSGKNKLFFWPQLYWASLDPHAPNGIVDLCKVLRPELLGTKYFSSGCKRSQQYPNGIADVLVDGVTPSLKKLSQILGTNCMYKPYDPEEVDILLSQNPKEIYERIRERACKIAHEILMTDPK